MTKNSEFSAIHSYLHQSSASISKTDEVYTLPSKITNIADEVKTILHLKDQELNKYKRQNQKLTEMIKEMKSLMKSVEYKEVDSHDSVPMIEELNVTTHDSLNGLKTWTISRNQASKQEMNVWRMKVWLKIYIVIISF